MSQTVHVDVDALGQMLAGRVGAPPLLVSTNGSLRARAYSVKILAPDGTLVARVLFSRVRPPAPRTHCWVELVGEASLEVEA